MNANKEGVFDLYENISFHHDSFNLIFLLQIFLLHGLESKESVG